MRSIVRAARAALSVIGGSALAIMLGAGTASADRA
jgi:hypothetical protein